MSAGHLLKKNAQTLFCFGADVTTVQDNTAASAGTDPSIVSGLVTNLFPGSYVGVGVPAPFWDRGFGTVGFASQDQNSLPLGGGVVYFLRLKISLAFSEEFLSV